MSAVLELAFMQRALVTAVIVGAVCAVVGVYVVLRGMAFIGDAVAHSVFPGVAAAYVLGLPLVAGGIVAGLATSLSVAVVSQQRRLKEDSVIGVFFAFAFGLGIVLVSSQSNYTGDLSSFLFGQILAVSDADVVTIACFGGALIGVTLLLRHQLTAVCLDRQTAQAMGLPVYWLDMALYSMVTVAIVMSLQAVGNILVLALLITPAATARLLTDRLSTMMLLSVLIGVTGSIAGLFISYYADVASGGMIVLVLTAMFIAAWLTAPRHGLIPRVWRRGAPSPEENPITR